MEGTLLGLHMELAQQTVEKESTQEDDHVPIHLLLLEELTAPSSDQQQKPAHAKSKSVQVSCVLSYRVLLQEHNGPLLNGCLICT